MEHDLPALGSDAERQTAAALLRPFLAEDPLAELRRAVASEHPPTADEARRLLEECRRRCQERVGQADLLLAQLAEHARRGADRRGRGRR